MSVVIGNNIAAMQAQRRLAETSRGLRQTLERLSSGQRINRAVDDAAGISISESLRADRRIFEQGRRNFNDGVSLLNIADSAVENLSNIVIRLKELAEQAANGTYGDVQRKAVDREGQALTKEYTRITQSVNFNGLGLLNGQLGSGVRLQGGLGLDGSLLSGVGGAIGTGTFGSLSASSAAGTVVTSSDVNADGIDDLLISGAGSTTLRLGLGDGSFGPATTWSGSVLADVNEDGKLDLVAHVSSISVASVSIRLGNGDGTFQAEVSSGFVASGFYFPQASVAGDFNADGLADVVSFNSFTVGYVFFAGRGDGTFSPGVARSDAFTNSADGVQAVDMNNDGLLDIVTADINNNGVTVLLSNGNGTFRANSYSTGGTFSQQAVTVGDFNGDGIMDVAVTDGAVKILLGRGDGTLSAVSQTISDSSDSVVARDFNGDGIVDLATAGSIYIGNGNGSFRIGAGFSAVGSADGVAAGDFNRDGVMDLATISGTELGITLGNTIDGAGPLLPFDIGTIAGARQALPVFDQKIQQLAAQRGKIGAFLSRIDVGIKNLESSSENYAAAESQIRDADIAVEASRLVKERILQQAASAILSQANRQPALALGLLRTNRSS